jgi:ABC-type uncharacterized transport system permease subunit
MGSSLLLLASLAFAASFAVSLRALFGGGTQRPTAQLAGVFVGFLLLTAWLVLRGQVERSCPLNSLYDVLLFFAWSLILIFLLVGPVYRMSLLGAFTLPLVLALLATALLAPLAREPVARAAPNPWIEFHAALSLIAYGCFGLASIAGVVYLLQERQLKAARFSTLLRSLPSISDLAIVNRRLLGWGFVLLSAAFVAGLISGLPVNGAKFWAAAIIWFLYGVTLAVGRWNALGPARLAAASVGIFAVLLASLPAIQHLSSAR